MKLTQFAQLTAMWGSQLTSSQVRVVLHFKTLNCYLAPKHSAAKPLTSAKSTALYSPFEPLRISGMPLDTSTYSLALLRVDGRRWNELRRCHAQVRTQAAADGSSSWEMGNTKVMCVLTGPREPGPKRPGTVSAGGGATGAGNETDAEVVVNIVVAGFSSVDRRRRGRADK